MGICISKNDDPMINQNSYSMCSFFIDDVKKEFFDLVQQITELCCGSVESEIYEPRPQVANNNQNVVIDIKTPTNKVEINQDLEQPPTKSEVLDSGVSLMNEQKPRTPINMDNLTASHEVDKKLNQLLNVFTPEESKSDESKHEKEIDAELLNEYDIV